MLIKKVEEFEENNEVVVFDLLLWNDLEVLDDIDINQLVNIPYKDGKLIQLEGHLPVLSL